MLDPDYLKDCTQDLENYWYNLETQILCDIAERIKLNENKLTSTANHEIAIAQNMGVTIDRLNTYLSEALDITTEEASKLIEDSSYMSVEYDNELFEEAYKEGLIDHFSYDKDNFKDIINEGIALTVNDITNLCNTTAQTAQEKLYESLNYAYMMAQSGAFGSDVIVDRVVSKLSREGLEWVDYDTGVHKRLDTVVRMAVRTSINQTAAKCQEKNLDDLECNLVETSAHVGARPSHAEWQGQIFYRNKPYKDYSNFYDATGYGTAGGLCGVNCRHSFYPYIEGISTPSFDKVDSKENNELYEKQQEQRYNERHIREWKRRQKVGEAAGLDVTKEKAKVREWTKRNQELIASDSRLKRNYAREKVQLTYKNGKIDLSDIKVSGALDPTSKQASKHAAQYYESVRKMKTDYKKIAKNTGYSEALVKRVKDYTFVNEHELINGKSRFYPDYHMAQSWQRLIDGKNIQEHDFLMLEHELYESILVDEGLSQMEAHDLTNQIYNYKEGCDKYDGIIKKFYKK